MLEGVCAKGCVREEAAGTAEEGGVLIRKRRGCRVSCEWPSTHTAAHHLLHVLSQVCANEVLRDGQLGGGGGGGGGEAPERETKSPLGCVSNGAGGTDEGAVGVGLVTETSAWQMHF